MAFRSCLDCVVWQCRTLVIIAIRHKNLDDVAHNTDLTSVEVVSRQFQLEQTSADTVSFRFDETHLM